MKIIAAIALLSLSASAASSVPPVVDVDDAKPSGYFIPLNLVVQIRCGDFVGTGSRINSRTIITATHVIRPGGCSVGGNPVTAVFEQPGQDFAVVRTEAPADDRIVTSCAGYADGGEYFAVGYAFGKDFVVQRLAGSKSRVRGDGKFNGLTLLRGNTYPGMSGGPIVNDRGEIVGIVNAGPRSGYSVTLSRALADTYLCAGK